VIWGEIGWQLLDQGTGVEFICENLDGWAGLPPANPTSIDRPFDYGTFSGRGWYLARQLNLTGVLLAPNREQLQEALHNLRKQHWLCLREMALLTVNELDVAKWLKVRTTTSGMTATYITPSALRVEIELLAPWPVKQSDSRQVATGAAEAGSGRHYPRPTADMIPGDPGSRDGAFRRYGPLSASGNIQTELMGNAPVRPRFRIEGPVTNPIIYAADQNRRLAFGIVLQAGDMLDVDADAHSVILNNLESRRYTLTNDSAWFDLHPGVNDIQYRSSSNSGSLTMFFADGWW
jgi:hypothetical protein